MKPRAPLETLWLIWSGLAYHAGNLDRSTHIVPRDRRMKINRVEIVNMYRGDGLHEASS